MINLFFKYLLISSSWVFAIFSNQNQIFQLTNLKGQLEVRCSSQSSSSAKIDAEIDIESQVDSIITCRREFLSPFESDFWSGPKHPSAQVVEFTSLQPDAKTNYVKLDYDGTKGITRTEFILWNHINKQNSILRKGINKIHYEIKGQYNETLFFGDFEIQVVDAQSKRCPTETLDFTRSRLCPETALLCETYFKKNNFCRNFF